MTILKKLAGVAACGIVAFGFAGRLSAADAPKQVNVYMFSEYIDPEMPKEFEKLTGMKCKIDIYEGPEEMLAKVQQGGGDRQYDVVVVPDVHLPTMIKLGIASKLDKSKLPNAVNVDDRFANAPFDPGNVYSLPYQWGTIGLIYNKSKVKDEISWKLLFNDNNQPGPFIMMDAMREMIGSALKANGYSMNTKNPAEVKAAVDSLIQAKKSRKSLGFEGGVGGKNRVASGEAALAVVYNGDAIKVVTDDKNIGFAVPKEGGVIWCDVMIVPSKAPNPAGGLAFMNYIMDGKVGAQLSNFNRYPTPNKASLPFISEDDKKNPAIYPPEDIMKNLEYLRDMGADTKLYDEAWTNVKAQ